MRSLETNSGANEGESGEQHLKAKMEDAEAKLEGTTGEDLGEPDQPPEQGRQMRRAEHGRRRERHVHDKEDHAEHGRGEVGELVEVPGGAAAAEAVVQVRRRGEADAVDDAHEDGRLGCPEVMDWLLGWRSWPDLEKVDQSHG